MATKSNIQWCDGTVNPIMGCKGCELFPNAATILSKINEAVKATCKDWPENGAKELYTKLIGEAYKAIENPSEHHKNEVTTTNIYHLRERFAKAVEKEHGKPAAEAAERTIAQQITCYAAKMHLNHGYSLLKPEKKITKRFAPTFEEITRVPGKAKEAASWSDLLGTKREEEPWAKEFPRLTFVSSMGDAFSRESDFEFLEEDTMAAINSEKGKRHLWLWLTKRPHIMKKFAERIGGFPDHVCAMTTMTSGDKPNQERLKALKEVKAKIKGLSIEPLWEEITPDQLNLDGIDWVIVGGESGSGKYTRPFHLEWAKTLREHCKNKGVAFFMKQVGSCPMAGGMKMPGIKADHGDDWNEWPEDLRVREYPEAFRDYRAGEAAPAKAVKKELDTQERKDLRKLETKIQKGKTVFMEVGHALQEIRDRRLYREDHKSFQEYCEQRHGFTRQYGYLLADAAKAHDVVTPKLTKHGLAEITTERNLRLFRGLQGVDLDEVIDVVAEEVKDRKKPIPYRTLKKAIEEHRDKGKKPEDPGEDDNSGGDGPSGKEPETPEPVGPGGEQTPEEEPATVEQLAEAGEAVGESSGEEQPRSFQTRGYKEPMEGTSPSEPDTPLVKELIKAIEHARAGREEEAYRVIEQLNAERVMNKKDAA